MADITLSDAIRDQVEKGREVSFHPQGYDGFQVRIDDRRGFERWARATVDTNRDTRELEEVTTYVVLRLGTEMDQLVHRDDPSVDEAPPGVLTIAT